MSELVTLAHRADSQVCVMSDDDNWIKVINLNFRWKESILYLWVQTSDFSFSFEIMETPFDFPVINTRHYPPALKALPHKIFRRKYLKAEFHLKSSTSNNKAQRGSLAESSLRARSDRSRSLVFAGRLAWAREGDGFVWPMH